MDTQLAKLILPRLVSSAVMLSTLRGDKALSKGVKLIILAHSSSYRSQQCDAVACMHLYQRFIL